MQSARLKHTYKARTGRLNGEEEDEDQSSTRRRSKPGVKSASLREIIELMRTRQIVFERRRQTAEMVFGAI